ncbi:electron transfer flavoprotein subunit alpha [Candidatus Bathyarchaeota archaeon]|nr:electron transfer flavoprotein subunit alpha [Candidatus Bathyarchaeota archaeon]
MSEKSVTITDACIGCGECTKACPFGSITVVDGLAVVSDDCRVCGVCVDACPVDAIKIKEFEISTLSDFKGVLVYAEQHEGKIHPVVYELLGKGRELADQLGEELYTVLIGNNIGKQGDQLISRGADRVYIYEDSSLSSFRDDPYTQILAECVQECRPSILLIGATGLGRALGPRVAARLKTGLTADCTGLEIDPETNLLLQTRPAYGGNIMATIITPNSRPQMATVRYKVMNEAKIDEKRNGVIINRSIPKSLQDRVKVLGFEPIKEEINITDADIIVAGGKGLNDANGFKLLEELAKEIGAAVGASRPTVDEGWITYRHQVGLSGKTVRPKLYIACGISGVVQHLAGMKTSDIIISINKDKEAPICSVSTITAIGDLYEVIPRLIEKIKTHKKNQ